jgi:hypothetical protein
MTRTLIKRDACIEVPKEVAVCPYCKTPLHVQANGWTERDDGTWRADWIDWDCETEPDIDGPDWEAWYESHSDMPYVHMLPVHDKLIAWMNEQFDFDMTDCRSSAI